MTLLWPNDIVLVAAALICHAIFNRFEPRSIPSLVILLLICPVTLGAVLFRGHKDLVFLLALSWGVYVIALLVSIVLYRLSPFHPLAKYPGPTLHKITKIRFASAGLTGKLYLHIQELHQRYGDIVRIGPNELSFADAAYVSALLSAQGFPRSDYWEGALADQVPSKSLTLIGRRNQSEHALLRKVWSRAFTPDSLKNFHNFVEKRSAQLVEMLEKCDGEAINLGSFIDWFAYDVMSDAVYGSGPEMLQNQDAGALWRFFEAAAPIGHLFGNLPWLGYIAVRVPLLGKTLQDFKDYCYNRTAERQRIGSPNKDINYYLLDEGGLGPDSEKLPFQQVVNDSILAVVAGSDSTATALASIFWLLIRHPTAYNRLREELDQAYNKFSGTLSSDSSKMPYLNAVINEAIRLYPPVPAATPRSPPVGSGGRILGSLFIPEGTNTAIPFYTIHRDPRNFSPLPDQFVPERWLPEDIQTKLEPQLFADRTQVTHHASAFLAFSVGPMDCIGKRLAMHEIRTAVIAVLAHFDLRFADGWDPMVWDLGFEDYFTTKRGVLSVILTKRSSSAGL